MLPASPLTSLLGSARLPLIGQLIIFGGRGADGVHMSTVHVADLTASPPAWRTPRATGTPPCARRLHAAALDPTGTGRMYVSGGSRQSDATPDAAAGDVFSLDLDTWAWSEEPQPPPGEYGTLIGVRLPDAPAAEPWAYFAHSGTWVPSEVAGGAATGDGGGAASQGGGCLLLFGGVRMTLGIPERLPPQHVQDVIALGGMTLPVESRALLRYCPSDGEWTHVQCSGAQHVHLGAFRHSATLVPHRAQLVCWGGFHWRSLEEAPWTDDVPTDHLSVLSLRSWTWTAPRPHANTRPHAITPRGSHSACLLGERLFVFGGVSVDHEAYERDLDEGFVLDLNTWARERCEGLVSPSRRSAHTAHVVPHRYLGALEGGPGTSDGGGDDPSGAAALAVLVLGGREYIAGDSPEEDEHRPRESVHGLLLLPECCRPHVPRLDEACGHG